MSDANRVNLSYVEEDSFGVPPSSSVDLKEMRWTSESLRQDTAMKVSDEVRDDRQVVDLIRTNLNALGDIGVELSYGAYDDLFVAALMSAGWSSIATDTQITFSMADGDNSINDSGSGFVTAGYVANQWVKISGFTTAANNGYFKLVSVAAGKMVLAGGTVVTEIAGDSVTIVMGAQIVNGTTLTSFAIEREYEDIANEFVLYKGMMIDQMSLNISAEEIITGVLSFLGKTEESATATIADTTTAAPTKDVMNAVDDVTSVLENMVAMEVNTVSFQLQNNLRQRTVVGELGPESVGAGSVGLTGALQAYFTSKTIMDKYLNHTISALSIVVEDSDGNGYIFDFPQVKFSSGQRVAGGKDSDVVADLNFTAYCDSTESVTIRIARFAA